VNPNDHYLVDVIGFNDVERAMLASIFALAARRDPGFAQFEPGASAGRTPDIYLVDADKPDAFKEFRSLHKRAGLPAVLIGTSAQGTDFPVLPRPLQWARLLQALDDAVSGADDGMPAVAPAADAAALRRSLPGNTGAGRSNSPQAVPDPAASKRMAGDTVLVVDDNATVRAFMQAKLAPFGFDVDFAETGEEAIGLSGTHEYTCVFLDVVLPGIDGYQVCKLIKSNKQAIKKTAVVMLTSRSSPFDKLRGSLAGCDEYLTKPLDEDRLLEVIAKFLPSGRKQAERASRK
jgi:twitching motility two-component system response regulator PilG